MTQRGVSEIGIRANIVAMGRMYHISLLDSKLWCGMRLMRELCWSGARGGVGMDSENGRIMDNRDEYFELVSSSSSAVHI